MSPYEELFSRNIGAITFEQQQLLRQKKAAVVGCGGLGGYVIEELVRLGLGGIHCFDPDAFAASNCNRQLNAAMTSLGQNKAEAAAKRAEGIHPYTRVIPFPVDFRSSPAEAFEVQVVIDCLDDIPARRDLAALCRKARLPLVHGAVNGWCGQVGVQTPDGDLMARLYPPHAASLPEAPPVLSCTVALVASLQVAEALKLLLGLPSPLENDWLHIDLKHSEFLRLS